MRRMATVLLYLFFIWCMKIANAQSSGKFVPITYYVSENGNDSSPGSKTKPFKTITRVNKLKLRPGDGVYFKGGEIFEGTLSITLNGVKNNPVLVSSYGAGRAIINGGKTQAMLLAGSYFKVSNINAKGQGRKE